MTANIKNDTALKDYIARLVYHGGDVDTFTASQLKDVAFITAEKDKVIRAMTYQWMKKNIREYLTEKEDAPFLEKVTKADEDAPEWLKKTLSEGKAVYTFDEAKIPDNFHADLQNINDYLYSSASNYLDKVLKQKNPSVSLDALKQRPEHKDFALTLAQAKKWHEEIARQAAERKIKEEEKQALEQGTEIVMDLGDGFKAVKLLTPEALDKESDYMGHCVGKGGYDKGVKDGTIQIVSIRDKDGEPHATLELGVRKDQDGNLQDRHIVRGNKVRQCKGKGNKPVVAKYVPYVQKFVTEQNLDPTNDLKNMGLCRDINGNIHNIYNIPEGTEFGILDLFGMDFTKLPDLSKCIVNELDICDCHSLTSLKGLPERLNTLKCHGANITSFEGCPESLEEIDCSGCRSLTSLEGLPEGLMWLYCIRCSSLTSLEGLPKGLRRLECEGTEITSLEGLPEGLTLLSCSDCSSLTSLEGLPKGLSRLECKGTGITSLESLPEDLKVLDCSYTGITSLEGVPRKIQEIWCYGCDNIKYIPDYIPNKVIKDLSNEKIAECKANWRAEQKNKNKANKQTVLGTIKNWLVQR